MHVVHINFSITVGGIDTMLIDILNEQVKSVKTTLIIINDLVEKTVLANLNSKVQVVNINRKEGSKNILKILKFNFLIFKLKPSIIHCHNSGIVNLLIFKKCPVVLTVHDVKYSTKSYYKYSKIFAISDAVKKDIEKSGKFPVLTVYNGINGELIAKKENVEANEVFKLVIVSRLEHYKKGHDLLFLAIKELKDKYYITLDVIGDGSSLSYLTELSKELEIQKQVRFLGMKTRDYIYENLKNYDLLIQPSRYEGFGLTIVEAMFAKVLVLTSDIDGPVEILNHGEYGFCFKSDDVKDLILKLDYILSNYESIFHEFTYNAYTRVKNNFSIQNTAENYINYCSELIKNEVK